MKMMARRFCADRTQPKDPMIKANMPLPAEPPATDISLMSAVAAADPGAQTLLVKRLAARVRRLTRLLCRAGGDADDAAQTALLEILASARTFHDSTNLEGWADRITARVVGHMRRRERLHALLVARWLSPGTLPWGAPGTTAPSDDGACDAILFSLSDARRVAFVLRHVVGCSVEEIADLTGAPPGTVKDRLVAARRQLRRWATRESKRGAL
jgi:RNA polymerase sigma-70 factor (ECF subfamily)